jgi:hypothetical protein
MKGRRVASAGKALHFVSDAARRLRDVHQVPSQAPLELHGLDLVADAVRLLRGDAGERDVRYAVVHLAAGVELLLKSWLVREHWALVFEKLDEATSDRFKKGEFKSAAPESCIERLERVRDEEFSDESKKALAKLRRLRNQILHFPGEFDRERVLSIVMLSLSHLVDMLVENCGADGKEEQTLLSLVLNQIREHGAYAEQRRDAIKDRLRALGDDVYRCPACLEKAVTLEGGRNECLFCRDAFHHSEIQEVHMNEVACGETLQRNVHYGQCPACFEFALGIRWPGSARLFCFRCETVHDRALLAVCDRCEEWMFAGADATCRECKRILASSSNADA